MQGFKSVDSAHRFLSIHAAAKNTLNIRDATSLRPKRTFRAAASEAWHGIKRLLRHEQRGAGNLLRPSLGHVTVPKVTTSNFKLTSYHQLDSAPSYPRWPTIGFRSSRDHARARRHGRDPRRGADGDDSPGVMLMMPTIMVPVSIPALDTMHYTAGDSLAWIPLRQGRCVCRQNDSGGGGI
jgi:hypothetical protein